MKQLKITSRITQRDSDTINHYFNDVNKYDSISIEEEIHLAKLIRENNDQIALNKLITANLKFAVSVAKTYQNSGMPLQDLIQEANHGLLKAALRFDERKGFKFISYAVWWIRQSIIEFISLNSKSIKIPINRYTTFSKINNFTNSFVNQFEREPTIDEICENLNLTEHEYMQISEAYLPIFSLNKPTSTEENYTLEDTISSKGYYDIEEQHHQESLKYVADKIFASLSLREAEILKSEINRGCIDDIAEKYDISIARVRQIKETAISKIQRKRKLLKLVNE